MGFYAQKLGRPILASLRRALSVGIK